MEQGNSVEGVEVVQDLNIKLPEWYYEVKFASGRVLKIKRDNLSLAIDAAWDWCRSVGLMVELQEIVSIVKQEVVWR